MFRGDRERSGTGSVRVSRLRLLDRPRGEPGRMAPPASRAAQRESEPQVSHLPGRERRARPRGGGARGLGTLRDWSGGRGGLPRGSDRPLPSRGDGAALQVCSEGTVTQPTSSPTLPLGLKLGAPRCREGGTRSSCCGRRAPESAAAARSAQRAAARGHLAAGSRRHRGGPGSSGRSRSSSAQRALPPGPASRVPSSRSCSSSCSSPPRDSSPSLPPAKSPARRQPRTAATAASPGARAASLPPVLGRPGARSTGRRRWAALPMAQPESRLRAPDRLHRGGAQVSAGRAGRAGRGPPARGVAGRAALPAPRPGVADSRRAQGGQVSRGRSECDDPGGERAETGFLPSAPPASAPRLRKSRGTAFGGVGAVGCFFIVYFFCRQLGGFLTLSGLGFPPLAESGVRSRPPLLPGTARGRGSAALGGARVPPGLRTGARMRSAKSRWAGEQPAWGPSGWFASAFGCRQEMGRLPWGGGDAREGRERGDRPGGKWPLSPNASYTRSRF